MLLLNVNNANIFQNAQNFSANCEVDEKEMHSWDRFGVRVFNLHL